MKNKKAIILPLVLWSLLILTLLFSAFHNRLKNNITLIKALKTQSDNDFIINNAINLSMALLYSDKSFMSSFKSNHINSNVFSNQNKEELNYSIKFELEQLNSSEKIFINGLYPLNSKININFIPAKIKNILIENSDFSEEQLASLFDWIDKDNDSFNNGKGAENEYYESQNIPYSAKNSSITTWSELYLIKDMNEDFINYLKNNFTIYDNGKININTVTLKTLELLGYNDSLSKKLIEFLSGPDLIRGTNDDIIVDDLSIFPSLLSKEFYFSAYEIAEILKHIDMFSVTSDFYVINIFSNEKKIAEAVISRNSEKTIVLEEITYCN